MVRVLDEFFDIDAGFSKGLFRLAAGGVKALDQRAVVMGGPHAAPAAAGDGLDHDGVADAFGHGQGFLFVFHRAFRAGRGLDAGFSGQGAAGGLVLEGVHGVGTWADEPDVAVFANIREMGIFG